MRRRALLAALAAGPAFADGAGLPQRPMTLVAPFTPGGPIDILARVLAQGFQARTGLPAAVENRAGGAGNIGIELVKRAPADGTTLLVVPAGNLTINPTLMRAFYIDAMGFTLSDEYPGHGAFLRCTTPGEHHNLFLLNRPGKPGVNHVAFTLADIHEVIGGGIAMAQKSWKTEIGPGRHPISSAYFWYFHNPLGAPVEYYADDDWCTEAWVPGQFTRKPELFAEWAIAGGIDGTTRRQVAAVDQSGRGHP